MTSENILLNEPLESAIGKKGRRGLIGLNLRLILLGLSRVYTRRLFFKGSILLYSTKVADVPLSPKLQNKSRIGRFGVRNWVQMPIPAPYSLFRGNR
jgi:hypothetical protein